MPKTRSSNPILSRAGVQARIVALVILGATVTACNFRYEKGEREDSGEFIGQLENPGYAEVNAAILRPKCLGCHATEAPSLGSYEEVVAEIRAIETTVLVKHTMPRKGPLAENFQTMLRAWIAAGTPRVGARTAPPVPGGPTSPYSFARLKAAVLEPKCNACHATGNPDGLTALDAFASTMSVKEWLIPLVFGVSGGETVPPEERMPPEKSPPLTDEEKGLLLLWYADGNRDENGKIPVGASP